MRLHHIGHLVKDIPAAAKILVENYGYRIESGVIEDPVQTAFVQFMRLPGATNWLELVSPNGENSKLKATLAKGCGLHHVCYEVDGIETVCAQFSTRKMMILSPPVPAVAFGGRRIAWFMDHTRMLVELVESGDGPLTLDSITSR